MKYNAVSLLGDPPLCHVHTSSNYSLIINPLFHIHPLSLQHYIPIASSPATFQVNVYFSFCQGKIGTSLKQSVRFQNIPELLIHIKNKPEKIRQMDLEAGSD